MVCGVCVVQWLLGDPVIAYVVKVVIKMIASTMVDFLLDSND